MQNLSARIRIVRPALTTYDAVGFSYDAPLYAYEPFKFAPLTMRMRIWGSIHITSLSMQTRIPPFITMRSRILRRQGWPTLDPGDVGYERWTDTRLAMRSSVKGPSGALTTLGMKLRIPPQRYTSFSARSRVIAAQHFQMRMHIKPDHYTNVMHCLFDVQQVAQKRAAMLFYIGGKLGSAPLQMGCYIVRPVSKRLTGHFLIAGPQATQNVIHIPDPQVTGTIRKNIAMRMRVLR